MQLFVKTMVKFALMAMVAIPLFLPSKSNACDNCQQPRVVAFDCKIVPPRPEGDDAIASQEIIAWRALFWAAAGIKNVLFNNDPTKECFTHVDGSFFTMGDTASQGITFGEEWANLPSEEGATGGDYLVTGTVDGVDGAYTVTAELQVSKTREVVTSATISFEKADGALDAGKSAAQSLGPIVEKIRGFEKKKRATGDPYALQPTIDVYPKKTSINKNESVEVEVWVYDCDGNISSSPLANRPVQLTVTGGTLSASEVTTGSDGKAVVTFTAGGKPMEVLVQAAYPFRLASEYTSVSDGGTASITVTPIPSTLWKVSGTVYKANRYDETKESSVKGYSETSFQRSFSQEDFRLSAVIRNISEDSLTLFQSDTAPVQMAITGTYSENQMSGSHTILASGWLRSHSYESVSCVPQKSAEAPEDVYFSFIYSPYSERKKSHRTFSVDGWNIQGTAIKVGQNCNSEHGCTDDNNSTEAEGAIEVYIGGIENDSGYHFDTVYTDALSGEYRKISERKWIRQVDESFLLHSYVSEMVVSSSGNETTTINTTREHENLYEFLISPLGKTKSSSNQAPLPAHQKGNTFHAEIKVRNKSIDLQYHAPENGQVTLTLYTLQGRVVFTQKTTATAGDRQYYYAFKERYGQGILCAEVVLTTAAGKNYHQNKVVTTLVSTGVR